MIKYFIAILIIILFFLLLPEILHKNKGESISYGQYHNGSIKNSYLLPRKGLNYEYGSYFSYYLLNRAYVNSKLYQTIVDAHTELHIIYPDKKFVILECSRKKGGKMFPHRTHQNGLSMDFLTPLTKKKKNKYYRYLGIFRYALNFDNNGALNLNKDVFVDFNTMARHIIILDKTARKHGLRIKKVIFKTTLRENLYQTENGKILKTKGIYLAKNLSPQLNRLHDDHYHADFETIP